MKGILFIVSFSVGFCMYPGSTRCTQGIHLPTITNAPIIRHFGWGNHVGVDYYVDVGSFVYAIREGVVVQTVQDSKVYGRYIIILDCDGYMALYGHLSKTSVEFGDVVYPGQIIGLSGGNPYDSIDGDGQTTGSHLHFELRPKYHYKDNKHNINPENYFIRRINHGNFKLLQVQSVRRRHW